ncbi:MAG: aspartate/glutamate racemase family protein [Pseudomonadota bacterium]
MTGPIVVINPNSNTAVTDGISAALDRFRFKDGPAIECLTLAEGPFGIESQADSDAVIGPQLALMRSRPDAGAFVIACYSDPGLETAREQLSQPVFGIQESGVLTAMARGDRFGVIALSEASISRHRRYLRRMGVLERLAAERAADLSVSGSAGDGAFQALASAGERLIADGADTIILGCAGMARHRAGLEAKLGLPVIDPCLSAVAMALGALSAE